MNRFFVFLTLLVVFCFLTSCATSPHSAESKTWQKTYGGDQEDWFNCVRQASDGVYVVKIDANGNLEWQETYGSDGSDEAFCIRKASDGGYIIAGRSDPQNTGMYDAYILKIVKPSRHL